MWALFAGTLLPVVAAAALVIALSTSHSGKTSTTKTTTTPAPRNATDDRRAAFEQCLRNSGVGSGGGGRFGGQSSQYREAIAVCSSLTQQQPGAGPAPAPPARTAPNVA
jgi:hypothetical protein